MEYDTIMYAEQAPDIYSDDDYEYGDEIKFGAICPDCHVNIELCDCGFDWDGWTKNEYC